MYTKKVLYIKRYCIQQGTVYKKDTVYMKKVLYIGSGCTVLCIIINISKGRYHEFGWLIQYSFRLAVSKLIY